MLNRRHKTVLFITLVATGSALLAGASLGEGLGIFILGATFAWVIGSGSASRVFDSARKVPSRSWPWVKFLLGMALGGCLLCAVAVGSNFNSFLVTSSIAIFGMLITPVGQLATSKRWLKFIFALLGIVVFVATALSLAAVLFDAHLVVNDDAERMGQLTVYALVALLIGMWWLVKGWRLTLGGINVDPSGLTTEPENGRARASIWLYLFLFLGAMVLTLSLGTLAFSAFSDSTFAFEVKPRTVPPNPLSPVIGLMLLAWWPYGCWKSILQREPNTNVRNVRRHKIVTGIIGGLFVTVLCVAVAFGIQNGSDRQSTVQVETATKGFQDVATKIGSIKSRDLRTTRDYIEAYEAIDPLLGDFDAKLKQFTDVLDVTEQRERTRGPLNIQRLYGRKSKEWLTWDMSTFALLREDSELTKKQIQVVRQMAELPEGSQVEYWKQNFQPLQQEEEVLRQKLATAQKSKPN